MSEQGWTIYVCDRCGSHDAIAFAPDLGAVQCRACSIQWLKEDAPTVDVIPTDSVQVVAERLREAAETNQENDPRYTGAITKSGAEERTYWDGRAAAFSDAADQLTSLCNGGEEEEHA